MNKQLLSRSVSLSKISGFLFIMLLPGVIQAQALSFGVTFGQPQDNNGPCVGKGMCKETFTKNPDGTYANAEAVTVTFQVSTDNPDVIMMSFSLSELQAKQPDKVQDFVNNGSYSFDAPMSLSPSIFGNLGLKPNAQILPNSPSSVVINGDFVTDYITYSHD